MKTFKVQWFPYPDMKPFADKTNGAFIANKQVVFPVLIAIDYPSGKKAVWSAYYDVYEDYFYVSGMIVEGVKFFAYIPKIERP